MLWDFLVHLDRHLAAFVAQYGTWVYALLFLIVFCETGLVVTPFLPGDSLLFVVGALAAVGSMDLRVVMAVLVCAALLGDNLNYWFGRWLGPRVFRSSQARWRGVFTAPKGGSGRSPSMPSRNTRSPSATSRSTAPARTAAAARAAILLRLDVMEWRQSSLLTRGSAGYTAARSTPSDDHTAHATPSPRHAMAKYRIAWMPGDGIGNSRGHLNESLMVFHKTSFQ